MTNLNSLVGFGAGGGGGGGLPTPLTDTAVLIDSKTLTLGSGNTDSTSGTTYNKIHSLATDGLYGGFIDAWAQDNSLYPAVYAVSFLVSTANGSIGTINETKNPGNNLYTSNSSGQVFSTSHIGSVGNTTLLHGHCWNPNSGTTRKGYAYGVKFSPNGSVSIAGGGYGDQSSGDNWPHSNGDLAMGTDSNESNVYFRRSTYYSPTGKYYHSCAHWATSGSHIGNQEHTANSNHTSTNYCNGAAKSSEDDRTPGGFIYWYGNSGQMTMAEIYGTSASRSSGLAIPSSQMTNALTLHMSTGKRIRVYNGMVYEGQNDGNAPVDITSTVDPSIFLLEKFSSVGNAFSSVAFQPTKNTDEWVGATSSYGLMKIFIDVNDNYKLTISKQLYTDVWGWNNAGPQSSKPWGLTGANDEYLVITKWSGSMLKVESYENPML